MNSWGLILATGPVFSPLFTSYATECGGAQAQGRLNFPNPVLLSWQAPVCTPVGAGTDLPAELKCQRRVPLLYGEIRQFRFGYLSVTVLFTCRSKYRRSIMNQHYVNVRPFKLYRINNYVNNFAGIWQFAKCETKAYHNNRLPYHVTRINPWNSKLNPICHLVALLGAHHILHVSRVRVKCIQFHTMSVLRLEFRCLLICVFLYLLWVVGPYCLHQSDNLNSAFRETFLIT